MPEFAKRLIGRVDALVRYLLLTRQLGAINKAISELDRQERRQLADLATRKTQGEIGSSTTTAEAFAKLKSSNAHVRVTAIAQWLGTVHADTRNASDGDLQELHRKLTRTLRELRASVTPVPRAA